MRGSSLAHAFSMRQQADTERSLLQPAVYTYIAQPGTTEARESEGSGYALFSLRLVLMSDREADVMSVACSE